MKYVDFPMKYADFPMKYADFPVIFPLNHSVDTQLRSHQAPRRQHHPAGDLPAPRQPHRQRSPGWAFHAKHGGNLPEKVGKYSQSLGKIYIYIVVGENVMIIFGLF